MPNDSDAPDLSSRRNGHPTARILHVDPHDVTPDDLRDAAAVLFAGGTVAFPTETVYGLGANALDAQAVQQIYAAKGRPAFNPLIVHVLDIEAAALLVREVPEVAHTLARAFWPGPLTLVMRKRAIIPDVVTAGLDSVGLRAPSHPVARALLAAAGIPVAAPSANRYTRVSPTTADHVERQLGDRIDMIIDGGATDVGIESTVLDVRGTRPVLLRPGIISREAIERVIGETIDVATPQEYPEGAARPSPGMVERHYAPEARIHAFAAGDWEAGSALLAALTARGERVGVITWSARALGQAHITVELPGNPSGYARSLYAALNVLDTVGCSAAVIERVPEHGEWAAIADRLRRAGVSPVDTPDPGADPPG